MSLSDLPHLGLPALRAAWRQLFRMAPPAISRDLLIRGLAYRMQEQRLGGVTKATQRKVRTLQQDFAPSTWPRLSNWREQIDDRLTPCSAPAPRSGSRQHPDTAMCNLYPQIQ